jgi:hypothetical protein
MEEGMFWFWNAPEDAHGTTMGSLALRHPRSFKSYYSNPEGAEQAQWTRASTMPHAVVLADIRVDDSQL